MGVAKMLQAIGTMIKHQLGLIVLIAIVVSPPSNTTHAAYIGANGSTVEIEGPIRPGDDNKFELALEEARQAKAGLSVERRSRTPMRVTLASYGGDVITAMNIGRIIRANWIHTSAAPIFGTRSAKGFFDDLISGNPDDARPINPPHSCLSACFLIWAGGVHRGGLSPHLGSHRPYPKDLRLSDIDRTITHERYRQLLQSVSDYLMAMDVPRSVVDKIMEYSSDKMYYVNDTEIKKMKVTPLLQEAYISACGTAEYPMDTAFGDQILHRSFNGLALTEEQQNYQIYSQNVLACHGRTLTLIQDKAEK